MEQKIRDFMKDKGKKVLLLDHTGDINTIYEWHRVQSARRIIFNTFILRICKSMFMPLRLKNVIFKYILGMDIGRKAAIVPDSELDPIYPQLISIGENSIIGWKTNILCHEFTEDHIRLGRVKIGQNTLIGAFTAIRSGVTIGNNSVVAMDSFVNKDVPDNELWGGVPAKFIKKLGKDEI